MENKDLTDTIQKLTDKKVIKIKCIPEFSLCETIEEGKQLLIETIAKVDLTIKEFHWFPEYDKIVSWMMTPNHKGLQLVGDPGRLKTTIATLAIPVLYHLIHNFIIRTVDSCDIEESYDNFKASPVIIMDDIGAEFTINDYGIKREPLNALIDFCEKKSKILIITSNLTSEQITARYGVRTIDRIDLLCTPVKFQGESLR